MKDKGQVEACKKVTMRWAPLLMKAPMEAYGRQSSMVPSASHSLVLAGSVAGGIRLQDREPRFSSNISLRIAEGYELCPVRLVDVSASGARLEYLRRFSQDKLVTLVTLHGLQERIPARVVWSNDRQIGVRFVMPLSQSSIDALWGASGPVLSE